MKGGREKHSVLFIAQCLFLGRYTLNAYLQTHFSVLQLLSVQQPVCALPQWAKSICAESFFPITSHTLVKIRPMNWTSL